MKTKIGYKVVSPTLSSFIISHISGCGKYHVKYKVGEWVFPNNVNMPLMIFENHKDAKDFKNCESFSGWIYKCEYVKSKKKWGWCLGYIDDVLNAKKQRKKIYLRKLPKGTILADKVKLLEMV